MNCPDARFCTTWIPLKHLQTVFPWLPEASTDPAGLYLPVFDIPDEPIPSISPKGESPIVGLTESILLNYYTPPAYTACALTQMYMEQVLWRLSLFYSDKRMEQTEEMILHTCQQVRATRGRDYSESIARLGLELYPDSSNIRCELIIDLWLNFRISAIEGQNKRAFPTEIITLFEEVEKWHSYPAHWKYAALAYILVLRRCGKANRGRAFYNRYKQDLICNEYSQ